MSPLASKSQMNVLLNGEKKQIWPIAQLCESGSHSVRHRISTPSFDTSQT